MMQPDAFADAVVVLVKNSLAPVMADVKSLQSQVAIWESRWNDVGALRERVAIVESKSIAPVVLPTTIEQESVDLSLVLERLAAAEARLDPVSDLRDRVVTIETKVAAPLPEPAPIVDLAPVCERVAAAEARLQMFGDLRDRLTVMETKAALAIPGPPGPPGEPGDPGPAGPPGDPGVPGVIPDTLQERLTALEAKAAQGADIAPTDLAASVAGVLRKELADLDIPAPRLTQKRIVRDSQGQIARVIEEPI